MNRLFILNLSVYIVGLIFLLVVSCKQNTGHVEVGGHVWMTENLKTLTYQNGDSIKVIELDTIWQKEDEGAIARYENNDSLANIYGFLYNWRAINDSRGLCPAGWHVATAAEWQDLIMACGGSDKAASLLKSNNFWLNQHEPILLTNKFKAIPGGNRKENGTFNGIGISGTFWSSTETKSDSAIAFYMNSAHSKVGFKEGHKLNALSCRCVLDYDQ